MKIIDIDIETYSSVDLARCGVYKYSEAEDFEILLFGYRTDEKEFEVIDLAQGEKIPENILDALVDDSVTKWAFNAQFERICLSVWLRKHRPDKFISHDGLFLNPRSWKCSMVWAAYLGMPLSLAGVGAVLNLGKQKLTGGRDLIRMFCLPGRKMPEDDLAAWEDFKVYNVRDVDVERNIQERLKKFPVPYSVWEEYWLDQEINDRGVAVDMELVKAAIGMDERSRNILTESAKRLTEIENPNSVQQLKNWLAKKGLFTKSLGKKQVNEMLKTAPGELTEVLTLRKQLSKSSVKKYKAMQNAVCADGRARGMFQFYGANRSGRWAGRLIQLHNLPQNHITDLEAARSIVRNGDYEAVEMLYGDVPGTLSQLIRTAFIPREGHKFIVADFSAIEARVLAWLAGETWRSEVFASGGDIYCASASQMFKVPVEKHGVNAHLRQKGKIAELALGYGGSVGALKNMGALEMGLTENELWPLVDSWRKSNPNITKLWWAVDRAALKAVREKSAEEAAGIKFTYESAMLFITLPSGRRLGYVKPHIGINQFGNDCITYEGISSSKKWERIETYGPKLVENIVQAIARDILAYAMKTLSCHSIVMHVHDEIIIEESLSSAVNVPLICGKMSLTPPWAKGLKLKADGFETVFYKKD